MNIIVCSMSSFKANCKEGLSTKSLLLEDWEYKLIPERKCDDQTRLFLLPQCPRWVFV